MIAENLPIVLRTMCESDLDAVLAIQSACYPAALNEDAATIRSGSTHRLTQHAGLSQLLTRLRLISSAIARISDRLPRSVAPPADAPDCLYLHDLAVTLSGVAVALPIS